MSEENTQTPAAEAAQPQAQAPELQPEASAPSADGGAQPAEAQQQPEQQQANPQGEGEETRNKNRERFDRRFSDLTRRARDAERDAAYWRGIAEGRAQAHPQQQPAEHAPAAPAGPPDVNDASKYPEGKYDANYAADLAEWRLEQKAAAKAAADAKRDSEAVEKAAFDEGLKRFRATVASVDAIAETEHARFFQNAGYVLREAGLPNFVLDLITKSEHPVQVAELIGRHDDAFIDELRGMDRVDAAARIGEVRAMVRRALAKPAEPKPQTAAQPKPAPQPSPAPIPTVNGTGAAPSFDPNKASTEDYAAWRANGGGR